MTDIDTVLLTDRTRMRPPRIEDFDDLLTLWGDPVVTKFITGNPLGTEHVWQRMLRLLGHWQALGYGPWIVEDRDTGRFMGEVGFRDYKRDITPSFVGTPELGWVLRSDLHGKGMGTETVKAAQAWGDRNFKDPRTVCIISTNHANSIRLAEKVGYEKTVQTTYHNDPIHIFERYR